MHFLKQCCMFQPQNNEWEGNNQAYIEQLNAAQRATAVILELILQDLELWDDEDAFFLEDDRVVLDREFQTISIQRFYSLNDVQFASHFRMNKVTFEVLIQEVGNHLVDVNRLHRLRTGVDVSLLMTLWILGNLSSFRGTAVIFGVSRSVVHFHYTFVIEALRELAPKFIKWPTAARRNAMKAAIERRSGFPGVVGMMDGTLVTVTARTIQRERYFDRHHKYSYNVLFVCDKNLLLTFVYMGEVGSAHDSRVFQKSALHDILLERLDFIHEDEHILADGAYTLTNRVLVPYRDNGRLTPRQRRYNHIHSSNRMPVECTNGLWKEKWRRLYRFQVRNADYALDHMMACSMLHNFVLLGGREPDGMAIEAAARQNDPDNADAPVAREHPLLNAARREGARKRDAIALLLHPGN